MTTTQVTQRTLTYRMAENEALHLAMEKDPDVVLWGEGFVGGAVRPGIRASGGWTGGDAWSRGGEPFGITEGLLERFGPKRLLEAPISEAAFMGCAVGAAMTGLRPVVELQFLDFLGVCMDPIISMAAKLRYVSNGKGSVPMTVVTNIGVGGGAGCHHSQSFYSVLAHFPGLKGVAPSDAYTCKGLMLASIFDDDPVFVFGHKRLFNKRGPCPEGFYTLPVGKSRVLRKGKDVTIVSISFMTRECQSAVEELARQGVDAELIDLLWLYPLDEEAILNSVAKTGHLVIVDEDTPHCSVATDVAAIVADKAFDSLDAPIKRVTAPHTPVPFGRAMEKEYVPDAQKVVRAVSSLLGTA